MEYTRMENLSTNLQGWKIENASTEMQFFRGPINTSDAETACIFAYLCFPYLRISALQIQSTGGRPPVSKQTEQQMCQRYSGINFQRENGRIPFLKPNKESKHNTQAISSCTAQLEHTNTIAPSDITIINYSIFVTACITKKPLLKIKTRRDGQY